MSQTRNDDCVAETLIARNIGKFNMKRRRHSNVGDNEA